MNNFISSCTLRLKNKKNILYVICSAACAASITIFGPDSIGLLDSCSAAYFFYL